MRRKSFYLFGVGEEGYRADFICSISVSGTIGVYRGLHNPQQFKQKTSERKEKEKVRNNDRVWCQRNIPSSIMWKVEVHHDWENGGVMYLLSPEEHRLRTRLDRWHKRKEVI